MAAGLKGMKGLAGELEQSARATVAEAQGLLDQAQAGPGSGPGALEPDWAPSR